MMKNVGRVISLRFGISTRVWNVAFSSVSSGVAAAGGKQHGGDTQTLYLRLAALGMKTGMVSTTINAYISEGKTPTKFELHTCIKELCKYGKPHLSLEIMEWMETTGIKKSIRDFPVHLDLVSKVKGIKEAELYFKGLCDKGRNQWTYGALLNCYCTNLMEDQALALFKEMADQNLAFTSVAYANVMALYMKLRQPEKVAPLVKDMKKRNIELNTYTYCIWMTSCSYLGDVEGAERIFVEAVKQNSPKKCNWTIYSNLAATYVKAGYKEKAELALKKVEEEIRPTDRLAYELLISLYAGVSNLSEVQRIWKSLKQNFEKVPNISYLVMLQALSKFDDLVFVKDCFDEWESRCQTYDLRIAHAVIRVYLRNHMVEEGQAVFRRAKEKSSDGPFWLSKTFMTYYLENNQGQKALDCMKEAVSQVKNNEWHLPHGIIKEYHRYFEENGDIDFGEEFCKLLKKTNSLNFASYKSLLGAYIVAGKKEPNMLERIKEDGIVVDTNLKHLIQKVCPESEPT